ncbi:MAG: PaaI family thioesterase [Polyangiales bacterium]
MWRWWAIPRPACSTAARSRRSWTWTRRCGAAVFMALDVPKPIATLDLRIDYLRPATPGQAVLAEARCFKTTKNVAFVRSVAYHDRVDDPIATATGTFMLQTQTVRAEGARG